MGIVLVILLLLVKPVGAYLAAVFSGRKTPVDRILDPVDSVIYRLSADGRRDQTHQQRHNRRDIQGALRYCASGTRVTHTIRKMMVNIASKAVSAISLGVFCRWAPPLNQNRSRRRLPAQG
jgi:K+-transporting ATPase A subunit